MKKLFVVPMRTSIIARSPLLRVGAIIGRRAAVLNGSSARMVYVRGTE